MDATPLHHGVTPLSFLARNMHDEKGGQPKDCGHEVEKRCAP